MFENTEIENIGSFLASRIDSYEGGVAVYDYGRVAKSGDSIVRVTDMPGRRYGELLRFEDGVFGMALDLEEGGVGAVLLSSGDKVHVGGLVKGTDRVVQVPVGDELIGRIIDPIGRACDGKPLKSKKYLPVERPAPRIIERRPVDTPLQTGITAIDSMIPIGRGQRELIIGDRQTGKTSIAVDTILNQKNSGVLCVYCAIGQKASTVSQVCSALKAAGAMAYTTVVAATASDTPAMQYLAPYSATSVAEYFKEAGRDVLVVYDDLSKHAVAYRAISLLLRRPPGREAYPGDVFYLHSRLLERAACMKQELGGGSITALPIIETTGGNISAYIPTNVISITDGQIFLENELFRSGIRPAINTGLSVSRVGRSAQRKAMRKVSGTLRIELAKYREMKVFARFGADLDPTTKELLARGERLTALFCQARGLTYSLSEMVCLLYAFRNKYFDDVETSHMVEASHALLDDLKSSAPDVLARIDETGDFDEEGIRGLFEKRPGEKLS